MEIFGIDIEFYEISLIIYVIVALLIELLTLSFIYKKRHYVSEHLITNGIGILVAVIFGFSTQLMLMFVNTDSSPNSRIRLCYIVLTIPLIMLRNKLYKDLRVHPLPLFTVVVQVLISLFGILVSFIHIPIIAESVFRVVLSTFLLGCGGLTFIAKGLKSRRRAILKYGYTHNDFKAIGIDEYKEHWDGDLLKYGFK